MLLPPRESEILSMSRKNSIRLRFDLDRDYATWFELGWSDTGEVIDTCNDMIQWNPDWYMASTPTSNGWNAELAIPISELVSPDNPIVTCMTHVGISVIHNVPGRGARVMAPAVSDRFQSDQWTIVKCKVLESMWTIGKPLGPFVIRLVPHECNRMGDASPG